MKYITKRRCLENITPYIPGKPVEEVERELGIKGVIKLASNENPLGPSPLALAAIQKYLPRVNYYPDGSCYYLKQLLAVHLGLREANIIVGNGIDELITLVGAAYLNPGDEVIAAHPSFSEYVFSARLMDAVPRLVPLKNYGHDLKDMVLAINSRTRVIFVCNPNNPTGTMVSHQELEIFLKKVPADILVVLDEAYYEYVTDHDYPRSLELLSKHQNVFVLRTFSKIYGLAGLRIGYGLAAKEIIKDLNIVREPFNVNALAQVAAGAALGDREHVKAVQRLNLQGRDYLVQEFDRMGLFQVPTVANFIFVEVGVDSRELFRVLLAKGVIVRTGDIFGYPRFLRVSIGTREQNRIFVEALEESLKEMKR